MKTRLAFLLADREFEADLPDGYDLEPRAEATINAFGGVRTIGYTPARFVNDPSLPELRHIYDATTRDGVPISVYERRGEPPTLSVVWKLADGYLCTFMDEPTATLKALEAAISDVDLSAGFSGVPRVTLGVFGRGDQREPTYRDTLYLAPRSQDRSGLPELSFTDWPAGTPTSRVSTVDRWAETSRTTRAGVRVALTGPSSMVAEMEREVARMADSLEAR